MYNAALISGDTAGGNISISQGNAGGTIINGVPTPGDQATVTGSKAGGNVGITIGQGSGSDDSATVSGSSAVGTSPSPRPMWLAIASFISAIRPWS